MIQPNKSASQRRGAVIVPLRSSRPLARRGSALFRWRRDTSTAKSQMKSTQKIFRLTWPCCFIAVFIFQAGFSCSLAAEAPPSQARHGSGTLTPVEAAKVAARLANDECERLYKKRPFTAKPYRAIRKGDRYRWGRLDVTGPGGFLFLELLESHLR